nr:hypothetical protein [uncultured Shinella sp.]
MSKIVVIGVEGDDNLWVADLDAGTIVKLAGTPTGQLKAVDQMRKAGLTVTQGVNLAAVAKSVDAVSGGFLDVSSGFLDASGGFLDN